MKELFCQEEVVQDFDQLSGEVRLAEDSTNQHITIGGVPEDAILLKLDVDKPNYKLRSAYLKRGLAFIHKGCDYVLILPELRKIILFELKSNSPKGYADQFVASELFLNYCIQLWNKLKCIDSDFEFKRILLTPKFNYSFTNRKMHKLTKNERCKEKVKIYSPGFPKRIRLEKLL